MIAFSQNSSPAAEHPGSHSSTSRSIPSAPDQLQNMNSASPLIALPGINDETVQNAKLQHVDALTALELTGIAEPGLLIPYHTIDGAPVMDGAIPYYRLRLDHPRDGKKYHQSYGSSPHAYIPYHHVGGDNFHEIILVEGEKKALALSDAGRTAFGISGFYGGATKTTDGSWVPVQELEEIRHICPPSKIFFAGDQDTLFNGQYYDAAIKLQQAFPSARVYCLQIPANAPDKGFDDCRATMEPETFGKLLEQSLAKAEKVQVKSKSTVGSLALESLKLEWSEILTAFKNGSHDNQTALRDNLVKLTSSLHIFKCSLDADYVINLAEQDCGYGRRAFNNAVKERQKKAVLEMNSNDSNGNSIEIIKTEQQGVWSAKAAEALGQLVYWHGKRFADVIDGNIIHFDSAQIATYLDNPDRCRFFRVNRDGINVPVPLTASDAEYIGSVPAHRPDLVRPIDVVSSMPVLIWRPPGYELVTGYDRASRVYANGSLPDLPSVDEAKQIILKIIHDFKFSNGYEEARCISFMLTPAIVRSGALGEGRCPFFYVSKDQKGAGGSFLVKLVASVYGMRAGPVVLPDSHPEKSKEGVSAYLAKGNHLVYLDNVRGGVLQNLAYLESLLTEPSFQARALYLQAVVDVRREVFACTSNGAIMSEDLASRTLEIRILRQLQDYIFIDWPEGDLLAHVEQNRAQILAAIYALVQSYDEEAKKTRIQHQGFRFGQWQHALEWLIQKHFPELPGLFEEGHFDRKQLELCNPHYGLLVEIFRMVAAIKPNTPISTTELLDLAKERKVAQSEGKSGMELGKILNRQFQTNGTYTFADSFQITRAERATLSSNGKMVKFYSVSFVTSPSQIPGKTITSSSGADAHLAQSFTETNHGDSNLYSTMNSVAPLQPSIHTRSHSINVIQPPPLFQNPTTHPPSLTPSSVQHSMLS